MSTSLVRDRVLRALAAATVCCLPTIGLVGCSDNVEGNPARESISVPRNGGGGGATIDAKGEAGGKAKPASGGKVRP